MQVYLFRLSELYIRRGIYSVELNIVNILKYFCDVRRGPVVSLIFFCSIFTIILAKTLLIVYLFVYTLLSLLP
jgi:ABC-type lipoprotein release transport system permease subunit